MASRTDHKSIAGGFEEISTSTTDSIELTRNAKGEYQWTIKVYHEPGKDSEALERLGATDAQLREDYLKKEEA